MTAEDRKQKVVCILGMHRSGTSALARVINLLGVGLGRHEVLATEPSEDNTKGHWEHKEIVLINEAILKLFGGSWHEPPSFPEDWHISTELDDLRGHAERLIRQQFAGVSLWGWKDPRTCLTLPFWQHIVGNLLYVLCLRNPVDVAGSLERRDQFLPDKSFHLWTTYVSSALKHTEGKPRLTVFYEDLMDECGRELDRLARFLDLSKLAGNSDLRLQVQSFVEKGLRHHQSSELDTTCNSISERTAKSLYLSQRVSAKLTTRESIEPAIVTALEALNPDLAEGPYSRDPKLKEGVLESLASEILRTKEIEQWVSARLQEKTRDLTSRSERAEESARALSQQLHDRELELESIKNTAGFRLLSRCWKIKHKYFPRSES